jgi:hypothetical protein
MFHLQLYKSNNGYFSPIDTLVNNAAASFILGRRLATNMSRKYDDCNIKSGLNEHFFYRRLILCQFKTQKGILFSSELSSSVDVNNQFSVRTEVGLPPYC